MPIGRHTSPVSSAADLERLLADAEPAAGRLSMLRAGTDQRENARCAVTLRCAPSHGRRRGEVPARFAQASVDLLRGPDDPGLGLSARADFAHRAGQLLRIAGPGGGLRRRSRPSLTRRREPSSGGSGARNPATFSPPNVHAPWVFALLPAYLHVIQSRYRRYLKRGVAGKLPVPQRCGAACLRNRRRSQWRRPSAFPCLSPGPASESEDPPRWSSSKSHVLVIGAGISGISSARHILRGNPGASLVVLERRARVGGTWDLFQYPGIRSDSGTSTFDSGFRPWRDARILAGGAEIRQYVEDCRGRRRRAEHVRFGRRAISADFSQDTGRWTVEVEDESTGERESYSAGATSWGDRLLRLRHPLPPAVPGRGGLPGHLVHPSTGRRTSTTPASASSSSAPAPPPSPCCPRWPTRPRTSPCCSARPRTSSRCPRSTGHLPPAEAARPRPAHPQDRPDPQHRAAAQGVTPSVASARLARKALLGLVRARAGKSVDMRHFSPRYKPWDQRLCVVPGGDLFKVLKSGKASIATDHISTPSPRTASA